LLKHDSNFGYLISETHW